MSTVAEEAVGGRSCGSARAGDPPGGARPRRRGGWADAGTSMFLWKRVGSEELCGLTRDEICRNNGNFMDHKVGIDGVAGTTEAGRETVLSPGTESAHSTPGAGRGSPSREDRAVPALGTPRDSPPPGLQEPSHRALPRQGQRAWARSLPL